MKYFELEIKKSIEEAYQLLKNDKEEFEFFWETHSPFSQWHKCSFTATPLFEVKGFESSFNFSSAEQFMMLHKALLFQDVETAHKIMKTRNVREQKSLGRLVAEFDANKWDEEKVRVVYEGNKNKFSQNSDLKNALIATSGKTLVEAAPDDAVWGIGLIREDPRSQQRETWLGTNLLGDVLTSLRIEFTGVY